MAATVRPRGPLPRRVYWTRRLLVLGVPLVLVVVLARVLGGSADGRDPEQATQAGARTTPTPAAGLEAGPTAPVGPAQGKNREKPQQPSEPSEPVLAEPTGPCEDSDIVVTPVLTQAAGGADVAIPLNLRTRATSACTWQVSADSLAVTITSGDDYIWSSRECPASIPAQEVVVRQAVDTTVSVTWGDARRSDETCSEYADWALPGWYYVEAAALGGTETDVQFELVAPAAPVVTRTAEPESSGGKGKGGRDRQQDTTHQPGEDGDGNSAG